MALSAACVNTVDKITVTAIRTLPKRYVRDGTEVCYIKHANQTTTFFYAVNPGLAPIHCVAGKWRWSKMKFIHTEVQGSK